MAHLFDFVSLIVAFDKDNYEYKYQWGNRLSSVSIIIFAFNYEIYKNILMNFTSINNSILVLITDWVIYVTLNCHNLSVLESSLV